MGRSAVTPLPRALVFIGFMGAGKSTAAAEAAAALDGELIDSDKLLEARLGHSIAREFELHGEQTFREHERRLVCELLGQAGRGVVIALGGGAVLSPEVRHALRPHLVVLLDVAPETAWERVQAEVAGGGPSRPLARDRTAFTALHAERQPLYESVADAILPGDLPGVARRALPALRALAALGTGNGGEERPRLVWGRSASGEYPVLVARGLLRTDAPAEAWRLGWDGGGGGHRGIGLGGSRLGGGGEMIGDGGKMRGRGGGGDGDVFFGGVRGRARVGAHTRAGARAHTAEIEHTTPTPAPAGVGREFCVTDANVAARFAPPPLAGGRDASSPIVLPPGEEHKTLGTAERVWRELAAAGMTRADRLLAIGGGVVGDLAGFCAATYQRGVPVVQVPTTLVAQVDSAYGGKTGVDLPEAKNYVGAYHQPAAVLVDPDALQTLPAAELHAGWVEVLKTALIAGGELWERVSREAPPDSHAGEADQAGAEEVGADGSGDPGRALPVPVSTILDCARVKLDVVAEDERDGGRRQVLNLGHTVGHAIETATGYARYRHGEAVGLGLLAALRLSGLPDLRDQVRELLAARSLPVAFNSGSGLEVDAIVAAVARDKKRLGAGVPFVLLDAPGETRIGCEVQPDALHAAVAELAGA
ncbi:MAG TPA: bifunctional shikimate kinase/3-dehydroquinate synthase [Solirubrobacteraceae bacterium]|nr:bifunctional shikimate kinase/3-dehydroquinate synthase [Solirubrobacteraceae bacterium]